MSEQLAQSQAENLLFLISQRHRARSLLAKIEEKLVETPIERIAQAALGITRAILRLEITRIKATASAMAINRHDPQPSLDYQIGTCREVLCQLEAGNSQPAAIFLQEKAIETIIRSTHCKGMERERLQTLGRRFNQMAQFLSQPH